MAACSHLNILNSFCFCLTRQVFQCEADDCGRFYHPKCVATLLYPDSKLDASLLGDKIAARQNFTCPIHECIVCKGEENKNDKNMQFAVCRSSPTTYHRGCLPRFSSVLLSLSCYVLLVKAWFCFPDSLYILAVTSRLKQGRSQWLHANGVGWVGSTRWTCHSSWSNFDLLHVC